MARKATKKPTKGKSAKPAKRTAAKRVASHGSRTPKKVPAEQGLKPTRSDVGYGKPPVEHQFAPGESGNPAGPPRAKSNLWRHYCRFLAMSDTQRAKEAKRKDLTAAEKTALKQVAQLMKKGLAGTAWLATKESWNRDEGKPTEHIEVRHEDVLSQEECDEIRQAMAGAGKGK